jgi:hypothetical protein
LSVAELEAADAAIWYDDQRPGLGDDFFTELENAFRLIQARPQDLLPLGGYRGSHDIRRLQMERFPYLVIVLRRADELLVVAVSHVRRRPFYWLDRIG